MKALLLKDFYVLRKQQTSAVRAVMAMPMEYKRKRDAILSEWGR